MELSEEALAVYSQILAEARPAGEVVEEETSAGVDDFEHDGAELNGLNSDTDDPLVVRNR